MNNLDALMREVRERLEKITPGPWEVRSQPPVDDEWVICNVNGVDDLIVILDKGPNVEADAQLIAHAPDDIRRLLDALEGLEKENDRIIQFGQILVAGGTDWKVRAELAEGKTAALREALEKAWGCIKGLDDGSSATAQILADVDTALSQLTEAPIEASER